MRKRKKKTTNSGTLEVAENINEVMPQDNSLDVTSCVTEEETEKTPNQKGTGDESADEFSNVTEDKVEFSNMCESMDISLTVTDKLMCYTDAVMSALTRKNRYTIVLIGSEGVGKKTVIEYLACRIARSECPELIRKQNTAVYTVDMDMISMNSEKFTTSINEMIDYAVSDGIENLFVYLRRVETGIDLLSGLYDEIIEEINFDKLKNFKLIACYDDDRMMTDMEVQNLGDFMRRNAINIRVVPEDHPRKVLRVLKLRIDEYEKIHNVKFPQKIREVIFMAYYGRSYSGGYSYKGFLTEVDAFLAMVEVSGKSIADRSDIKHYYHSSFVIMDDLPDGYNYTTAVHESGHILLALAIPKLFKLQGASILYDDLTGIEGVTISQRTTYMSYDEKDMVEYVAMLLAGRAAELEFCVKGNKYETIPFRRVDVNKGASSDIREATDMLREWVAQNGAYRFVGYNLFCGDVDNLTSLESIKVDIVVKWMLRQAYERAKHCVRENRAFIDEMQKFLLKNTTATIDDIIAIARRTIVNL